MKRLLCGMIQAALTAMGVNAANIIEVTGNRFVLKKDETAVSVRGVEGITVSGNVFDLPSATEGVSAESLIESKDTSGLKIYDNKVVATP